MRGDIRRGSAALYLQSSTCLWPISSAGCPVHKTPHETAQLDPLKDKNNKMQRESQSLTKKITNKQSVQVQTEQQCTDHTTDSILIKQHCSNLTLCTFWWLFYKGWCEITKKNVICILFSDLFIYLWSIKWLCHIYYRCLFTHIKKIFNLKNPVWFEKILNICRNCMRPMCKGLYSQRLL